MSDEEAVGHGTTLITVSSRSFVGDDPARKDWALRIHTHAMAMEGKDHGSVFVCRSDAR